MFHVEWLQEALDELAAIWIAAGSSLREAITRATHDIDQVLQRNPYLDSESRGEDSEDRVLLVYPLGVNIEIDLQRRIVWILNVWRFRRRGESV